MSRANGRMAFVNVWRREMVEKSSTLDEIASVNDWQCKDISDLAYPFLKSQRLTRQREISQVFRLATHRVKRGPLTLLKLKRDQPIARLGLAVPKRQAAKAVERNRIKRVIREWFRINQHQFDMADFVVLLRRPLRRQSELRQALDQMLIDVAKLG